MKFAPFPFILLRSRGEFSVYSSEQGKSIELKSSTKANNYFIPNYYLSVLVIV